MKANNCQHHYNRAKFFFAIGTAGPLPMFWLAEIMAQYFPSWLVTAIMYFGAALCLTGLVGMLVVICNKWREAV